MSLYTPEAKAELRRRFENGYSAGAGFYNDVARTLTDVTNFLNNPSEHRSDMSSGVSEINRFGQSLHTTALYAFALDNVATANVVMTELLAQLRVMDLNSTFWNNSSTYNFSAQRANNDGGSMWQRTGKINQLYDSYIQLKNIQSILTGAEIIEIDTFFQRYKELVETAVKGRIDTIHGSWVDSASVNYGAFENDLWPTDAGQTATPITDAVGVVDNSYVFVVGQSIFSNRQWDGITYILSWASHNNDIPSMYWCRQFFKMAIKYGMDHRGDWNELYRNNDSEPRQGFFYTNITRDQLNRIAHIDASFDYYPNDRLYDYETNEGVLNGSTTNSLTAYVGSDTTDGVTMKSLGLFNIRNSQYYRSIPNGGVDGTLYFTSFDGNTTTLIDLEGYTMPSTSTALANLYYKNQTLKDYYLYVIAAGYPAKQSILSGAGAGAVYDEDYGAWMGLTEGAMWLEMEDFFFNSQAILGATPTMKLGGKDVSLYLNGKQL